MQISESLSIEGNVGVIEALRFSAQGSTSKGTAIVTHPHPLYGGNMQHKVVQTLIRAFTSMGWNAVCFNFRGVGASAGAFDHGEGETLDLQVVIDQTAPTGALCLAGFSFGTHVICEAIQNPTLQERDVAKLVFVGTAASRFKMQVVPKTWHNRSLMIHGEDDDTVPLQSVMQWARPQNLPITVVPQGGHFFHGQQILLRDLVLRHLSSV